MTAPPSAVTAHDTVPDLSAAGRRAIGWLLGHLNPDGSLGRPEDGFKYYRAPWAFAQYGESDAGHAVCGWIRANLLTGGPADLGGAADHRLAGPLRVFSDGYAYRDSGLIVGAQMLHQHDLSIGLIPELLRSQDPVSGGFANDLLPAGPPGSTPAGGGDQASGFSDEMDIPYACGPGFACLLTGRMAEARRVAGFLQTIYDAQTELPERFFCFWSRSRQAPIREGDPGFQQRYVVENTHDRMQRWTIGGIAAAFLGRLYLADPQERYLTLARQYQAFSMAGTDAQFSYPSACKSSWGAALLYQITGEQQYLDWLGRFARWYIDSQEPDGYWHPWAENTLGDVIEITLEFAMHISTLTGALNSRPVTSASAD